MHNKRTRIVGASMLMVLGVAVMSAGLFGDANPTLSAASVAETGINWTKVMVWVGAGSLFVSALMFVSASAE